jgi:hypothetical protein
MGRDIIATLPTLPSGVVIEGEFYSEEMNFAEIIHFFRSEDVTSEKSVSKYTKLWNKTMGSTKLGWPFPGRTVEWLTTWHKSLKFYVFDIVNADCPSQNKRVRNSILASLVRKHVVETLDIDCDMLMIPQTSYDYIDAIYQAYDQSIMDGNEGLVLIHKDAIYKFGRHTLNSKLAFKIKDDNLEFDGQIVGVEESTVAREGAEKTVNELGRSVTSKLQEDRVPSGMAKGFLVQMEGGRGLTVSLNGYDHSDRVDLLENASSYIGRWIKFTGMAPVKEGGCPRHAHFTKGNFRDDK